jgi:hypothetical protein
MAAAGRLTNEAAARHGHRGAPGSISAVEPPWPVHYIFAGQPPAGPAAETCEDAMRKSMAGVARSRGGLAIAVGVALALAACGADVDYTYPTGINEKAAQVPPGGLFGNDLNVGLGGSGKNGRGDGGAGIGVNSYLWRASLDTISFMPLASADPFGGVIITDWYTPPESPSERFKMNVYILGRQLRADGVRVAVFRQSQNGDGWQESSVKSDTAVTLENQILTRARQLRIASAANTK